MKDNDSFGVESIIIWNTVLIFSFILIISLGYIAPLFNNSVSSISQTFSAKVY